MPLSWPLWPACPVAATVAPMNLTPALRPLALPSPSQGPQSVVLNFNTTPAEGATPSPTPSPSSSPAATLSGLTFPVTLTVQGSTPTSPSGTTLTLSLPDGRTLTAQSPTPLPTGSTLTLPNPPQNLTEANPTAPLLLRALPQPPQSAATPQPAVAGAAPLPAAPTPAAPQVPTLTLTSPTPLPAPLQTALPQTPIAGPLVLQTPSPLPATWANQPLTLTLTTPTQGTLKPSAPQNSLTDQTSPTPTAPAPILPRPITLPQALNLPLKQPMPIVLNESIPQAQPQTPQTPILATIIAQSATTSPQTLSISPSQPSASLPSAFLSSLRILMPAANPTPTTTQSPNSTSPQPTTPEPLPLMGTFTARVLPLPQGSTLQPLLLPNGQLAQIELPATPTPLTPPSAPRANILPQGLPAGSVVVVNIPTLSGPAQILQLHTNQPQLLPQAGTAASATAPQTPQAILPAGTVVAGTIVGQNANGQPLLTLSTSTLAPALAGQTFALSLHNGASSSTPLAAALVVGAKVQVQVGENGTATLLGLTLPAAASRAATLATLGSQWPMLQQALNLLQNTNPYQAAQARKNLPQLANLLPGLLRLMESLPEADTAKFLSPEAARLAHALGANIGPDMAQLQALMQRPEEGGWRGLVFPYLETPNGQPKQGGFFWRREKEDEPRSPTNTRFVAELELSSLGPLQLDGLLTYPALWLKLRSQNPLPAGMTEELQTLVSTLLQQFGLDGGISTETTPTFPVSPAAEIRAHAEESLSIPS